MISEIMPTKVADRFIKKPSTKFNPATDENIVSRAICTVLI